MQLHKPNPRPHFHSDITKLSKEESKRSPSHEAGLASQKRKTRIPSYYRSRLWKRKLIDTGFELSFQGNAKRFAALNKKSFRFVENSNGKDGAWITLAGAKWVKASRSEIWNAAQYIPEVIRDEAKNEKNRLIQKSMEKHAILSASSRGIREMLHFASVDPNMVVTEGDLATSRYPGLLNCKNGIVDLRTGELRSHDRELLLTQLCPVRYDSTAKCPNFMSFLEEITGQNEDLIEYLQILSGYAASGDNSQKAFFVLFGPTNTGKTTFNEIMGSLLGDYSFATPMSTILTNHGREGHRSDLARLRNARYVFASETSRHEKLDSPTLKRLTGGDTIVARHLRDSDFPYKPLYKIFFATNELPRMDGDDDGIWGRMQALPFSHQLKKVDPHFMDKLKSELPGILAWTVEGAKQYYATGKLNPPKEVVEATILMRAEADPYSTFIKERCIRGQDLWAEKSHLYNVWVEFCRERDLSPGSHDKFGKTLNSMGIKGGTKREGGELLTVRFGVALKT